MKKIKKLLIKLILLFRRNMWVDITSKVDSRTVLEGYNKIFERANIEGSNIGLGTYIGKRSFLPKSKIGRFCTIGPDVKLVRGKHPAHDFVSIHPAFFSTRKQAGFTFVNENKFDEFSNGNFAISIGNDVWIGSDVLILDGVTIGDGAIIGAGATISKNIEPYSINVGNPIKEIGKRFTDKEIEFLLKNKWWKNDIEWLKKNAKHFENIAEYIKTFKK